MGHSFTSGKQEIFPRPGIFRFYDDFKETLEWADSKGGEAFTLAQTHHYALILMDMQMPIMDGLEATEKIRQLPNHAKIPIIALTANAFVENRETCLQVGMNDFVPKPVEPELLYSVLLGWLRRTKPSDSKNVKEDSDGTPSPNDSLGMTAGLG